jgi:hypothetical protein
MKTKDIMYYTIYASSIPISFCLKEEERNIMIMSYGYHIEFFFFFGKQRGESLKEKLNYSIELFL